MQKIQKAVMSLLNSKKKLMRSSRKKRKQQVFIRMI
jgi:hypothetical protein